MTETWTLLIASHAIAASLALVIGPYQILRKVKGDKIHIFVGRTWAVLMLWVAAGSFFFGGYGGAIDIFLRALACWTLFSVTFGIWRARKGDIKNHRGFMVGTYFGLVAAFIGVIAVRTRLVPTWFVDYPLMMSLITVGIIAVAGFYVGGVVTYYKRQSTSRTV